MEYRRLGNSGLRVSAIGLGSFLTIGMSIDDETSRATVRRAYELGVNFFDTANAYNKGQAEIVLGKCLSEFPRSSLVIASKVYAQMGDGPNDRGLRAKHVIEQCDASLKRLGIDYLDLYQCHRPVKDTPIEETVRAMEDLARRGKILYWGTSNFPGWMISEANRAADRMGARSAISNQPRYSLLYRVPEMELFQYCRYAGIGNVVYSPLAHGVLSGKYAPGQPPAAGTRAANDKTNTVIKNMYWSDEKLQAVQQLRKLAEGMGATTPQLALAWVLRRPEISSAITGASKISQVEDNVAAAAIRIPDDVLQQIEKLFPGPEENYPLN